MILLDTNVVSELMRPAPASLVLDWFARQRADALYLSTVSEAELRLGVGLLPEGQRRARLAAAIEAMLETDFAGRILSFDRVAARHYARIVTARRTLGRPVTAFDAQIAAIACAHDCALATRNLRDFAETGVALHDPFTPA